MSMHDILQSDFSVEVVKMSENTKDEITIKTLKAKITISELKARARRQIKGSLG